MLTLCAKRAHNQYARIPQRAHRYPHRLPRSFLPRKPAMGFAFSIRPYALLLVLGLAPSLAWGDDLRLAHRVQSGLRAAGASLDTVEVCFLSTRFAKGES